MAALGTLASHRNAAAVIAVCVVGVLVVPEGRHLLIYNLLPLLCLAAAVMILDTRVPHRWLVAGVFALVSGLHLWSAYAHPVHLEPDSAGYIAWAREFAHGNGFPGMIYRAPGYSFVLGLTFLGGSDSLLPVVLIQHGALIAASLLIYLLALECGYGRRVALLGMILFGCNSVVMQLGQWIMTEALFTLLVTGAAFASVKLMRRPSIAAAAATGACFAGADLLRPMLAVLLGLTLGAALRRFRKPALRPVLIAAGLYAAVTVPWSVRNAAAFGTFSLSGGRGVQLFTKATSYGLLSNGPAVRGLQPSLDNVCRDLGVDLAAPPVHPEDEWTLNRVPHVLTDSLLERHGRTFAEADRMMRRAALEGFAAHPGGYVAAVGRALAAMLFTHREMYPRIAAVAPVRDERLPAPAARLVRGLLYVPGILLLAFPAALIVRRRIALPEAAPFLFLAYGYILTAAVQVGFTRYTAPWSGLGALCAAFVLIRALEWGIRQAASASSSIQARKGPGARRHAPAMHSTSAEKRGLPCLPR